MSHHDKLLMDFLKHQNDPKPSVVTTRRLKTSSKIMDPAIGMKPEVNLEFIIEKKPNGKKVLKFLQQEIDAIMKEADA